MTAPAPDAGPHPHPDHTPGLLPLPAGLVPARGRAVVLLDGASGSGKTTLAAALAAAWPTPIRVVALDEFYPGWGGLAAASAMVAATVLRPQDPGYRRWDWEAGRPAEWVALDPDESLLVEGCGALTPASRALASAGIWVVGNPAERKARALARDGEQFAPHWDEWAAQERAHWRANRPRSLADWWWQDGRLRRAPRARGDVHTDR